MFMLSIANNSPNGFLEFEAVKNIEIGPDRESKQPLPDSAKWMNGSVKNIIINSEKGETLENVESRLANIYFGKASKSQNVKNATRLILEEFEKLYQMQYHSCLKK